MINGEIYITGLVDLHIYHVNNLHKDTLIGLWVGDHMNEISANESWRNKITKMFQDIQTKPDQSANPSGLGYSCASLLPFAKGYCKLQRWQAPVIGALGSLIRDQSLETGVY